MLADFSPKAGAKLLQIFHLTKYFGGFFLQQHFLSHERPCD